MKRFLSLLMVFVLAFSLSVPVGATEIKMMSYNGNSLPDIETVRPSGNFPYASINKDKYGYQLCFSSGVLYESETGALNGTNIAYRTFTLSSDGVWTLTYEGDGSSGNILGGIQPTTLWVSYDLYDWDDKTQLVMVGTDPVELMCDGSSCPATDANVDGFCDDCGMMLMSLSRSPVAPDVTGNNKNYVMFYSGTVYQYTAYTSNSSYTIRGEEYGARYRTYLDPSATATRFQSYDGINWEQTYNGATANDYPGEIGWELISSTYDWYTEEGDRFFPVPLWEEVQTVTQGEMGNLTSETAGTMRTLVVCGVGLMACLMALSLFGKRWLLFLR